MTRGYVGRRLSEMLPGVLAAAEAAGSDGRSVLLATAICYELQAASAAPTKTANRRPDAGVAEGNQEWIAREWM